MARTVVGLDIGTTAVRAVELVVSQSPPGLRAFGEVPLPVGSVFHGEIREAGQVSAALSSLWRQAGFRTRRVVVGLANEKVALRQIELPLMDYDDLRASLTWQIAGSLPFRPGEAVLDAIVLGGFHDPDGTAMMRVLVVGAGRDMIDEVVSSSRGARLQPTAIDLTPFALARSLVPAAAAGGAFAGTDAILDIGAAVTNVVVRDRAAPRFARILSLGGEDFTEALATDLGLDHEAAEQLKLRVSAGEIDQEAMRTLSAFTDTFATEVVDTLRYYDSQPESPPVDRLILAGGGSRLPLVEERLRTRLPITIERGQALNLVRVQDELAGNEPLLADAQVRLAVPIGLALRGMAA